jgi:RNA-directed DNA polymerase
LARFKETLREQTPRNSGLSLAVIIERLNRRLRGWYRYFQGGVKNVYRRLDEWLRGRLRSILRRRDGRKGRGRGRDHNRYPIAYFANLKLISLYASACGERFSPAVRG